MNLGRSEEKFLIVTVLYFLERNEMAIVNANGYIGVKNKTKKARHRIFWIGKPLIALQINLPKKYWGKRIYIKIIEH